jgi:hypothetical protein
MQIGRKQYQRARNEHQRVHGKKCGKDAPDAALIEVQQGKAARANVSGDMRCDQKPGDHKKHIDADKTTAKSRHAVVIQDDQQYRDRAQTVDIGTIVRGPIAARGPFNLSVQVSGASNADSHPSTLSVSSRIESKGSFHSRLDILGSST